MKLSGLTFVFSVCIIMMFSLPDTVDAQRNIERNLILNPLADTETGMDYGESAYFSSVGGWASFGNYGLQRDEHHLWYHELGTYLELYRVEGERNLIFTTQIEFIADPHNDINFNPRAIYWEEGFLFTRNINDAYLQLGLYHRCKHDIDNLRLEEERSITFGGPMIRMLIPFSIQNENDAKLGVRADHYLISWEGRIPREMEEISPNWGEMSFSGQINFNWKVPVGTHSNMHFSGYGMATAVEAEPAYNGRIQVEIGHEFGRADARFGIFTEYLHDSGIPAEPSDATLVGVGIRAMTAGGLR